jgi:hypothetical protein
MMAATAFGALHINAIKDSTEQQGVVFDSDVYE